jgi:hypothetical protein
MHDVFVEDGLMIRSVFREMVQQPEYQGYDEQYALKMAPPELLSSQVSDLTGFTWNQDGRDLVNSSHGYVLLAGGADGDETLDPAPLPTVTMALVQQRLADKAAHHVIEHDRTYTDLPTLMTDIDFTELPGGPHHERIVAQLQSLHLRMFGRVLAADAPEISANLELWQDLYDLDGDIAAAWKGVVGVLLRDPDLILY